MNTVPVVHVSFATPDLEDPFPAVLPMIGFLASFENQSAGLDEALDLYLHGYVSSRLMELGKDEQGEEGYDSEDYNWHRGGDYIQPRRR